MKQAILTLLLLGGAAMADAQETPDSLPPTPRSGSEETAGPAPPPTVMLPPVIVVRATADGSLLRAAHPGT